MELILTRMKGLLPYTIRRSGRGGVLIGIHGSLYLTLRISRVALRILLPKVTNPTYFRYLFDEGSVGWMECDDGLIIMLRSWKKCLVQEQWALKLMHRCCGIGFHRLHQFCFKCEGKY